jgi:molybdate transport system permease protein
VSASPGLGDPRPRASDAAFSVVAPVATLVLLVFLALPLVALLLRVPLADLAAHLASPRVLQALRLSLLSSLAATAVVVVLGTPAAYLLATRRFPGKRAIEALVDLPMVLPPTVAGFALLMAFGRAGLAGRALALAGLSLPFTTLGVVVAQVFMAAPFFVSPTRAGFAGVDRRLTEVAATLGASEAHRFFHVMLPLARPALLAGLAMCAARALGEFGATITFAGNLPGTTQTMPLAVYVALQSDLDAAVALSVLLLAMSFGLLLGLRAAPAGWFWNRSDAGNPGPQTSR